MSSADLDYVPLHTLLRCDSVQEAGVHTHKSTWIKWYNAIIVERREANGKTLSQ